MTDITADAVDFRAPKAAATQSKGQLRKRLMLGLGLGVALATAGTGVWYWQVGARTVSTDNAYVGADVAQINSQVSGPIAQVTVDNTRPVHKGDVLVVVDDSDARLAVDQAEANYRSTLQRVSQYYANRAAAAATVEARLSDVSRTSDDYARRQRLAQSGAISIEALSTARTDADA
ncbi:MAG TPA: biotin/lipoyl-binding protein, partial [Rhizomicrobium sp.]|nr:biotin/lipoyl-binding protein [Rhizomicrobium sp.]